MRLHRFFIGDPIVPLLSEISIDSADIAQQIRRVFRLGKGDEVIIFDGSGKDFRCGITEMSENSMKVAVLETFPSRYVPKKEIILCAALVKKDTFEWIVEKATELGVSKIIPVMAERSEKKSLNEERLNKIAIEASEQSGRGDVPIIERVTDLQVLVSESENAKHFPLNAVKIAFHPENLESGENSSDTIDNLRKNNNPVAIFIGPEGGWSPAEIDLFKKYDVHIYCLGTQVLRTETAVIAALAQIVF